MFVYLTSFPLVGQFPAHSSALRPHAHVYSLFVCLLSNVITITYHIIGIRTYVYAVCVCVFMHSRYIRKVRTYKEVWNYLWPGTYTPTQCVAC